MRKSLFITLEGGEGVGKSSLVPRLAAFFEQRGTQVLCTREPGGTLLGEAIRRLLLEVKKDVRIYSTAELFLFLAARSQHLDELIMPALEQGKVVLCDRFNDSTIAYQGIARGLGGEYVADLCKKACRGKEPDLTLLLDAPVQIGLQRTRNVHKENAAAGSMDRIEAETVAFHEAVRQALLKCAEKEPGRFIVIDASKTQDEVCSSAINLILQRLDELCLNM